MSCYTIEELDRYLVGELEAAREHEVEEHAATCAGCRRRLAEMSDLSGLEGRLRELSGGLERPASRREERTWSPPGYDVIEEIHRGGEGVVYEAVQRSTGRHVAIKILRSDRLASERARHRFEREFDLVKDLDHPNLVGLHDGGLEGDRRWFVMPHIQGRHLDAWQSVENPSLDERLELFGKICRAVHHAHQQGVIHRDLKPRNILVDDAGEPRVLDFGVARSADSWRENLAGGDDVFAGTLPYAAPELLGEDAGRVDVRGDVYGLGVLLYELLSGRHPFQGERSMPAMVEAILKREPDPPSRVDPGLDADLDAIVARAMAKDPVRRYASAAGLWEDVERYRRGEPVEARRGTPFYVARKTLYRYRVVVSLLLVLIVVLGVASTVSYRLWRTALNDRNRAQAAETEAREGQLEAERALAERRSLADIKLSRELVERADMLFPVGEGIVSGCESWIAAAGVVARRSEHRRQLLALRLRATPFDEEEQRRQHPLVQDEIALQRRMVRRLERLRPDPQRAAALEAARAELARLERVLATRIEWSYADEELGWMDEVLSELLARIVLVDNLLFEIRDRLERARTLHRRTVEEQRAGWSRAAAALRADPRFEGFALTPQPGLVPLRTDPHSGLLEFWHVESGARPRFEGNGAYSLESDTGVVLVLVPGGRFEMGCRPPGPDEGEHGPSIDPMARAEEGPVHEVVLEPYFIARYEMTRSQWIRIQGDPPGVRYRRGLLPPQPLGGRHPIGNLDWFLADEVCSRLGLALPTEAQWECAARAGTRTRWYTGDRSATLEGHANVFDAGQFPGRPRAGAAPTAGLDDGAQYLAPVGSYAPNPWGLHDVVGNVQEWCQDWIVEYWRVPAREPDGLRIVLGGHTMRALRGGSCAQQAEWGASGIRGHMLPDLSDNYTGVRPSRAVDP